jgi:hypothetical protein
MQSRAEHSHVANAVAQGDATNFFAVLLQGYRRTHGFNPVCFFAL